MDKDGYQDRTIQKLYDDGREIYDYMMSRERLGKGKMAYLIASLREGFTYKLRNPSLTILVSFDTTVSPSHCMCSVAGSPKDIKKLERLVKRSKKNPRHTTIDNALA